MQFADQVVSVMYPNRISYKNKTAYILSILMIQTMIFLEAQEM